MLAADITYDLIKIYFCLSSENKIKKTIEKRYLSCTHSLAYMVLESLRSTCNTSRTCVGVKYMMFPFGKSTYGTLYCRCVGPR